jgi:ubiquitin-like protein Pup
MSNQEGAFLNRSREADASTQDEGASLRTAHDFAPFDAVLDAIDSVLAVNAEEFVRNFVQKGGE